MPSASCVMFRTLNIATLARGEGNQSCGNLWMQIVFIQERSCKPFHLKPAND